MTLNLTYRHFVYYRCNVSFGDMLHSTHGLDYTQNMVVYACPRTNRMVVKMGVTVIQVQATTMVIFMKCRRVHASRRWYEGEWSFQCLMLIQDRDI